MADEKLQEQEQEYRRLLAQQQRNWGIQPDAAAQQRNTARQLGVPTQAVHDAPEYAAQRAAFEKVWRETEGLGTLRGKMAESEFHALAKDDVAQLGTVEKHARAFTDGAVEGTGSMMEGFGEMLGAGWRSFVQGASRLLLPEKEGVDLSQTHMGAVGQGDFEAGWNVAGGNVKQTSNQYIDIPEAQKTYSTHVAGGLGQLIPQAASHLMFGGAGTVLTGAAMSADQMADEVRNDNAPQLNKDLAVLGSAAFTGLSDKLVFDRLSGAFKPAAGQTLRDSVKRIGIGTASEALQEASESVVNDMLRQNLTKPEHEISLKQALESGSVGGGVGFVATALFESAAGIRLRHQQRAAERAQADGEHLQQQSENMAQSNLARRAPDVAADYVNEVYGQSAKLYVDADALMQSGVAERVVEKMPQLAPKLAEAAATGGMVEISRGDLHTVLNEPEIQSALLPHVRTSPDAMTATEAKQFAESGEAEAMAEALNEAVAGQQEAAAKQESLAAVDAAIRSQLMDTGRFTPEQAGINAALAASQYQATAARLGMTAEALYRQRPLNIVGEPLHGGLAQALAANPPRGWVHAEDGQAAADLWNGNSEAQAVFWTGIQSGSQSVLPETAEYSHSISADTVRHIRNRHGSDGEGQLPVSAADIASIPEIIAAADEVREAQSNPANGAKRLMYARKTDDGLLVYIEEARKNRRDLKGVTLWKYPPTADVAKVLEHVSRPSLYVRNGEAAYSNDTAADSENQLLYQAESSPRGMFDPASDTIAVLKRADASTFAHELGHFFLEMHTDLAVQLAAKPERTAAENSLVQDVQTLMDWFGVADVAAWRAMTLPEQRAYHEQFARGFEAYLYEGKAPSSALREVFRRFAAWLKHVYRSLAALNVELTDDVRAVYGRMLATEEAIEQTQYESGMLPLFASAEDMGVSEEAFAEYRQAAAQAEAEAQEELQGKALRDLAFVRNLRSQYIRNMKKQHKADFEQAEMDARRSIMRQPVYRAWQLLTARMDAENRIDDSKEQRELRRKAKVLQGAPVFEVESVETPRGYKAIREWAEKLFADAGGKAVNPELGEVVLSARSVKDSLAHGISPKKKAAFAAVSSVIEKGVVIAQAEHGQLRSFYISAPVRIGSVDDIVTVLVRKDVNTQRMYLHSVMTKESLLNYPAADAEASEPHGYIHSEGRLPNAQVSTADTEVSEPRGKMQSGDVANILRRYLTVNTGKTKVQLDNTTDSLFTAIAKLGGLNREEVAAQWGLDAKDKPGNPVFGMPVLRRSKGKSLDAMVEVLAEEGYLPVDNTGKADVRDLEERFFDELRGTPRYSRFYVPQEPTKAGSEVANLFALTAVRFDHDSLVEMGVGEDMLAVLKARGMVRKSGGLHPDFVAEMVRDENGQPEFASGETLLRAVFEAEPPQEAIEQTAYLNVLAARGEVPTQAVFEAAADVAVHSRLRARILAAEFKALSKATGSVSLLRRAAANHARDRVADIRLADLRPAQYTRAEARAARLAQQAMARAEIQEAAGYKRSQLVQNALAREALTAQEEAAKARRDLSALANRTLKKTAKSYDADLMSAAQAVVGMFGIAPKKGERAAAYLENLKQYDPQSYDLAAGVVQRAEDLAYRTDGRFENLTVAQMRALRDDVMALRHTARRMREVEVDGKRMSIEEAEADLRRQMDRLPQRLAAMGDKSAPKKGERAMMKFYETSAALRRVESWAQAMDGLKGFAFQRYVFQPIKDASDRYRAEKAGYLKRYRDIIEGVEFKRGKIEAPELGGYVFGEESGGTGMNEVLHAILHTGNASNKRKLLLGRKWAHLNEDGSLNTGRWDAFVARLIAEGKLTKQHFDAAQQIWDLMEEMKPKAQAAHREMLGYYFDEITAELFMTPFGEYRGGYVPALKDARIVPDAKDRDVLKLEQEAMQHAFPATGRGFTKNRTESNDPLLLNMNSLSGHIDQVLRFSHLQVPLRDVNRLLNGIKNELDAVAPGARKHMLEPWLKRVATQKLTTPDQADGFFGRMAMTLRNRAGMAAMIGNIPNAVQQLAGFPLASAKVQPKYLARATADFIAHPKQVAAGVAAASPYMDARLGNQIGIMTEHIERILVNPTRWERFNNWTADHAYFAQEWADSMMAPIIWQAAYNQSVAEGANHRDAVRFADSVIRQTQGSILVEDVSKVETGSPLWRLATQFYGYFNMLGNLLVTETLNAKRDLRGGERTKKLLYIWGVAYYATAVTAELLMGALRGGYEDEDRDGEVIDDWIKQVFFLSPGKTLFSMFPLAGNLLNFADDKPYNDRAFSPPAVAMLERSLKAATGRSNFDKQSGIRDAGTALAMLFGIPAAPLVAKPLGYWRGVETGEIRPTGAMDAVRGSITGTASPASK